MVDFISNRIKAAIDHSGKSKAQIAREVGVTAQAVGQWIKKGSIDKANLIKLSNATGCSDKWLITGEGEPFTIIDNHGIREDEPLYDFDTIIDSEISQIVEYAICHQLNSYYKNLPEKAQVKLVFELYKTIYADRAILNAAKDMQPSTLLKMVNG